MLTKRHSDHGFRLLALPGELRKSVYSSLFAHDAPIEIRRSPIFLRCERDQRWFIVDGRGDSHGTPFHHLCDSLIKERKLSDIYLLYGVRTHSEHYPCPRSIARCDMNLNLLLTCRQIYREARELPYTVNTFRTRELGTFSNFVYCLKSWQVRAIRHLSFDIAELEGMTRHLPEWNDIFSLLAASFPALKTISIQVYLHGSISACWSSFWDGGLLELDRLNLRGVKFTVLDRNRQPVFIYDEARSRHQWSPFHDCRERLRVDRGYGRNNYEDRHLFYWYSPNPCPLYIRNIIHLMAGRDRWHSMRRPDDQPSRNYPTYHYDFGLSDTAERAITGYEFPTASKSKAEIEDDIRKLHLTRRRLAEKITTENKQMRPRRFQANTDCERHSTTPVDSTWVDNEVPGEWRRRLNEETFAPFFETFPPMIWHNTSERVNLAQGDSSCTGCSSRVETSVCFLSRQASE